MRREFLGAAGVVAEVLSSAIFIILAGGSSVELLVGERQRFIVGT